MVKSAEPVRNRTVDPTPEEIRLRTAIIRRGWSQRERTKRAIWNPPAWLPPLLEQLPEIPVAADRENE